MANELTDSYENSMLNWVLNVGTPTRPSATYIALFTAVSNSETPSFTEVTNANSYARTSATFSSASGGATSNSADVTFPTATGSWGTVTHIGVCNSATHNNTDCMFVGALTASKTVDSGDTFKILAGDLDITLS